MFSSFIGKNSTAEKTKIPLAYSDFYINFASDLTSFLLGESRRVERTYSSKENGFLSIRFLLSTIPTEMYSNL